MKELQSRIHDLLDRMTIEEKAAQMIQIPANLFTDEEAEAWRRKASVAFCIRWASARRSCKTLPEQAAWAFPCCLALTPYAGMR